MTELYKNKDWLYDQYWNQEKSIREIGKTCNVSEGTIRKWMIGFNIRRRDYSTSIKLWDSKYRKSRFYRNKDWLYNQYCKLDKSLKNIQEEFGYSTTTIKKWLKRFGINIRERGGLKGEKNPRWRGGVRDHTQGYKQIYIPNHHLADGYGYVTEHILNAEKKYKRKIKKGEQVHHIDGDKKNNKPENLYICSNARFHSRLHKSMEKIVFGLYKKQLIKFDEKNGRYYISREI